MFADGAGSTMPVGEPVQAARANELIRATARTRIVRDMEISGEG
jgi:hypothetical protein